MLPGGTDPTYRAALTAGHAPYIRVDVWRAGVRIAENLAYADGSVHATLTSRVSRTLDLTVHETLYPYNPEDLLAPFGNELRAYRGIRFADGHQYVWQVFRGRITDARLDEQGTVNIQAADRAADVESARFEVPENAVFGATIPSEFQRLVSDALPDAQFGDSDTFAERMPQESWEHDRAAALDEMSTAVGAFWYPLADGQFVLRRVPWTVPGDPVITLADGTGGAIFSSQAARAREGIFNSVTVTGERADGTAPVSYTARDNNPLSPTWVGGPFGVRNKQVQLQTPQTSDSARGAAQDYLRRTTALTEQWGWSCAPDAALELGDIVRLDVRERVGIVQVVAEFTMPLGFTQPMTVRGRSQVIGTLEAGGINA